MAPLWKFSDGSRIPVGLFLPLVFTLEEQTEGEKKTVLVIYCRVSFFVCVSLRSNIARGLNEIRT